MNQSDGKVVMRRGTLLQQFKATTATTEPLKKLPRQYSFAKREHFTPKLDFLHPEERVEEV